MKTRIIILISTLCLFNSCIVKSLFPFFTKDTIYFEKALLGNWKGNDNQEWKIISLKDKFESENKDDSTSNSEVEKMFKNYLKGYYIERIHKNKKTSYLAVPFKLNHQLFLDFQPFSLENEFKDTPTLVNYHFVTAHSLVKVELSNTILQLKWLDSDEFEKLLKEKRIKIKHIRTLDYPEYLLTAPSEELQKFITKYMASNSGDKWSTDINFQLKRINAKS